MSSWKRRRIMAELHAGSGRLRPRRLRIARFPARALAAVAPALDRGPDRVCDYRRSRPCSEMTTGFAVAAPLLSLLVSLYRRARRQCIADRRAAPARLARSGRRRSRQPGRCRNPLRLLKRIRPRMSEPTTIVTPSGLGASPARSGACASACCSIRAVSEMRVAIIDYGSGNLRSATKAFERAAREAGISGRDRLDGGRRARAHRRSHRAAGRRRLCRLPGGPRRRRRHGRGDRRGCDRATRGRFSASASACS